jgi:hypothetical protein
MTLEKLAVVKPWRRPRPMQGCSASKDEEMLSYYIKMQVAA